MYRGSPVYGRRQSAMYCGLASPQPLATAIEPARLLFPRLAP